MDEFGPLKDLIRAFNSSAFTHYVVTGEGVRIHLRQKPRPERKSLGEGLGKPHLELHRPVKVIPHDPGKTIISPRVGHFFPLRNPHGELALKGGDMIEEGQAFGLVESMNLKYEIRADKSGQVDRYLIEDGEAVEFGQPLILLK